MEDFLYHSLKMAGFQMSVKCRQIKDFTYFMLLVCYTFVDSVQEQYFHIIFVKNYADRHKAMNLTILTGAKEILNILFLFHDSIQCFNH